MIMHMLSGTVNFWRETLSEAYPTQYVTHVEFPGNKRQIRPFLLAIWDSNISNPLHWRHNLNLLNLLSDLGLAERLLQTDQTPSPGLLQVDLEQTRHG
jgi:hypothetical protein